MPVSIPRLRVFVEGVVLGRHVVRATTGLVTIVVLICGCRLGDTDLLPSTGEVPLHLEEHLDAATIVGSEVAVGALKPVEWLFTEPQPDWRPVLPNDPQWDPVSPVRLETSLRMPLNERHRLLEADARLLGAVYVEVPGWRLDDWSHVEIRARASESARNIGLMFNLDPKNDGPLPFAPGIYAPLVTDGSVQTYRLPLRAPTTPAWSGTWTHLGLWFNSRDNAEEASIELLSIRLMPAEATYADAPVGVRTVKRGTAHRRTLYTHTPGRIDYRVSVPEGGRLDLGLGVVRDALPVTFRVTAQPDGGGEMTLLEATHADRESWAQRSVDLSQLAGQTITLRLEAESDMDGGVALWAAPTLSGARTAQRPNVILYVIDGGGADHMSLYGYNRRTTPNLDRLAAEGVVFERAYSNASWSKPSTASFMTSLQHSVLGGVDDFESLPSQAVTITELLHQTGYQTAVLTTNGYVGVLSGFDRGADLVRDEGWGSGVVSSVGLHRDYWDWRETYPSEPYFVHFQTTDVHRGDTEPGAPFAGLFITPEARERSRGWQRLLEEHSQQSHLPSPATLRELGLAPKRFYDARRNRYDEGMAHQDYQLGKLVERLRAAGEWEHTLLIVAADHGPWHAGLRDPLAESERPIFQSTMSRIPLIFIWPERIPGGQRFSQPVSMIDVLPTILDLVDLPRPEIAQGQSLAPLMLGEEGWEPRPVILDEFYPDDETGELRGVIELVNDRWGASLLINPTPDQETGVRLLLCDLWTDPYCRNSLHEVRPDLVEEYTEFLETQFEAHLMLAERFTQGAQSTLTPEQLRTLRTLGYIN